MEELIEMMEICEDFTHNMIINMVEYTINWLNLLSEIKPDKEIIC
jgi:hypothetical protein